ncbi:MAG: ATP-binding cassette domain-containing protein, partial [Gaiellaceae bacterium]
MALLTVENVTRRFGGIVALDDVSLELEEGTIAGLIGPNGAGKTTLFNVITRLYRPDTGRVDFDGRDLLKTRPYRVVRTGVARTFQNIVLFPTMTVAENILVGAHTRL